MFGGIIYGIIEYNREIPKPLWTVKRVSKEDNHSLSHFIPVSR